MRGRTTSLVGSSGAIPSLTRKRWNERTAERTRDTDVAL